MADSPLALSPTLSAAPAGEEGASRLAPGTGVGEYVIDRFLGAGAMGEVYAGHHPVIGKNVAVKVLRRELATSEEAAERFTREARAVNQVDHPNVIDVFAYGRTDDGRLYLVMDLCPGTSLRAKLAGGALPVAEALDILAPIADALDAAHGRGVVHRDLKPDNIMVADGPPRRVFVLDFGIAKLVSNATDGKTGNGTLTGQGTWLGTPAYMAPEQWSTDGAGPASDRYALGVIAFELLSGSRPFAASSVPGMMEQHFRAAIPALSARGLVSSGVDGVLQRALAKDPDARFATATELVEALRVAAGTNAGARGTGAPPGHAVRRPWLPAVLGIGVLGAGVAGVLATRHGSDDHRPPPAVDPNAGTIAIEITSTPDAARVAIGDHLVGTTPYTLQVKPDTKIELDVRKPGYLASHRALNVGASDSAIAVNLTEVTSFQGVWKLPNGELRAFERQNDRVAVFKLAEVDGPRTFWRHYAFVDAERGVAFALDEEAVDERAPEEPSCHVSGKIEYRFDTTTPDVIELRRPNLNMRFEHGHCMPQSHDVEVSQLVRVGKTGDTRVIQPPVGIVKNVPPPYPFKGKTANTKKPQQKTLKIDPVADLKKQEQAKVDVANKKSAAMVKKPTSDYTSSDKTANQAPPLNDFGAQQALPQQPPPQIAPPQQSQTQEPQQRIKKLQ